MTTGGEFNSVPEGMFNVSFEMGCEDTTGATGSLFNDGDNSIIGPAVGDGPVGAGLEGGDSNEELEMNVVFLSSQPNPGNELFWGITTTEEFSICWVSVIFRGGGRALLLLSMS